MEWGPVGWKFLHYVTFAYPMTPSVEQQNAADHFFGSLGKLLPCDTCQEHYQEEVSSHPPDTRSQATLSAWLVDLHNRVNARLGKPHFTYNQAAAAYSSQCTTGCAREVPKTFTKTNTGELFLMILLVMAAIGLFYISRMNR